MRFPILFFYRYFLRFRISDDTLEIKGNAIYP